HGCAVEFASISGARRSESTVKDGVGEGSTLIVPEPAPQSRLRYSITHGVSKNRTSRASGAGRDSFLVLRGKRQNVALYPPEHLARRRVSQVAGGLGASRHQTCRNHGRDAGRLPEDG